MPKMPRSSGAFSEKQRIAHSIYGLGTISYVDERLTTIDFDENGTRKFLTDVVRLEPSDTPTPAKPVRTKKVKSPKPK